MSQPDNNIKKLSLKLEALNKKQEEFQVEIQAIRKELIKIKEKEASSSGLTYPGGISAPETDIQPQEIQGTPILAEPKSAETQTKEPVGKDKSSFERFIGENLINKIGIIILVIGVSIGAKYAIDNQMIGPISRILLGYILGLGLLVFAIKLKKKYEGFSAVLLSGAMAILYFITFAAYSFYSMIPQSITFGFLIFLTAATVVAAINYNRQIIAHIGLVGAYVIPFLFSRDPDKILFLFLYTSVINFGILIIAIRRYWKLLYLSASSITWLLYLSWYLGVFEHEKHFTLAFSFLAIFFILFFATFIVYKLVKTTKFDILDVALLLFNSFIFYSIGFFLLSNSSPGEDYIGLFTLATAIIHFIVAYIVYLNKLADKNLFYLLAGMVLVFLTIAFPVQFEGGWVTMFWAGEATILFWIGRTRGVKIYEYLSYPIILLAFFSIIHDWQSGYNTYIINEPETRIDLFFNVSFVTSVFLIIAYNIISGINRNKHYLLESDFNSGLQKTMRIVIPSLLLLTVYFAFRMEISNYWNQLFIDSEIKVYPGDNNDYTIPVMDYDLRSFKTLWLLNYTMLFLSLASIIIISVKSKKVFSWIVFGFNVIVLLLFLSHALYELSELRESYLSQDMVKYYDRGMYHLIIRYISLLFVTLLLISTFRLFIYLGKKMEVGMNFIVTGTLLWILSSELLHWFDIFNVPHSYKIGLSIFWGIYALLMVVYGIAKRKKHIRIAAFGILGFTLLKLFIYDLSHMSTLSRAIIFILLGIVLLGVSFLYNKYKNIIIDET